MTTLEIVFVIFAIALLFAGYIALGTGIVYSLKIPNRWLRVSAVIFWPITLLFLAVTLPFMWLHDIFNSEVKSNTSRKPNY